MSKSGKFLLLHIDNEQSKEVLKDAIQGGIERGLMFRSEAPLKLLEHFNTAKEKGYFPVGCVLDAPWMIIGCSCEARRTFVRLSLDPCWILVRSRWSLIGCPFNNALDVR